MITVNGYVHTDHSQGIHCEYIEYISLNYLIPYWWRYIDPGSDSTVKKKKFHMIILAYGNVSMSGFSLIAFVQKDKYRYYYSVCMHINDTPNQPGEQDLSN